jgi:hypothetical protein
MSRSSDLGNAFEAYRGIGGFTVVLEEAKDRSTSLTVLDGVDNVVCELGIQVRDALRLPSSVSSESTNRPFILRYAGRATHPAGNQAPISWVNGDGRGLIRIVQPGSKVLLMPLVGIKKSPHDPIVPRGGQRGPSRSSDLWLVVTAWCQPAGFTAGSLARTTGISAVTARHWVQEMLAAGFIAEDARSNDREYVLRGSQSQAVESFVQERWREWRRAMGHSSLRPAYFYFSAQDGWSVVHDQARKQQVLCFASGITVLEGGPECGPKSWILPGGLLPEVFLYTSISERDRLVEASRLVLRKEREREDDSTLCVLPDDHPAIRLYQSRITSASGNPWPWGIAALDAWDHRDPRVRQAARQAWQEWIENRMSEPSKDAPEGSPS